MFCVEGLRRREAGVPVPVKDTGLTDGVTAAAHRIAPVGIAREAAA